jgi:hypothetical protein
MSEPAPPSCSLSQADLERRLEAIAAIGEDGLTGSGIEEGRNVLRFRAEPEIRRRLEDLVAAEAKCCSFLGLELAEADGELRLSIDAPADAQDVADGLAAAFGRAS